MAVFSNGLLGQYYDVQGMSWTAAPMFANPDQTVTVGNDAPTDSTSIVRVTMDKIAGRWLISAFDPV